MFKDRLRDVKLLRDNCGNALCVRRMDYRAHFGAKNPCIRGAPQQRV